MSYDDFLSGRSGGARVTEGAAEAVAKAEGPVTLKVVRVDRGGAPSEVLACVAAELPFLEDQLGADPGVVSWTVEDRDFESLRELAGDGA